MTPLINTNISYTPPPPNLVATTIPGNSATQHVPVDNVPPSVSNAQVGDNASNNSNYVVRDGAAAPQPASPFSGVTAFNNAAPTLTASAQTTFMAQLMSQDDSPASQTVLVEYERIISNSEVKYKPSNAQLPSPEPAGLFGKLVQQEKVQTAQIAQVVSQQAVEAAAPTQQAAVVSAAAVAAPAPKASNSGPREIKVSTNKDDPRASDQSAHEIILPYAIGSYTQSASRISSQSLDTPAELVG